MKKYIKYLITTLIGLIFIVIVILAKGIFSQQNAKDVMHILTDATFASGALIFCFGILVVASNGGTFDMLSYGMISFISMFKKDVNKRKYKTFYDYRQTKQASPKPYLYLIIVGAGYILISLIFLLLYYKY